MKWLDLSATGGWQAKMAGFVCNLTTDITHSYFRDGKNSSILIRAVCSHHSMIRDGIGSSADMRLLSNIACISRVAPSDP